jgi:hypothetical protein
MDSPNQMWANLEQWAETPGELPEQVHSCWEKLPPEKSREQLEQDSMDWLGKHLGAIAQWAAQRLTCSMLTGTNRCPIASPQDLLSVD